MDYRQLIIHPDALVAPNATIVGRVTLEKDVVVLFNAVLRGDYGSQMIIGRGTNVQENACLHLNHGVDCLIGNNVTIGHGAIVHGATIGDNTLVGMGSIIMDKAVIGKNCLIGAGALVTEGMRVPDNSLVVGLPGKVVRTLTPEEVQFVKSQAPEYVELGRDLAANGIIYTGRDVPKDIMTIAVRKDPTA